MILYNQLPNTLGTINYSILRSKGPYSTFQLSGLYPITLALRTVMADCNKALAKVKVNES